LELAKFRRCLKVFGPVRSLLGSDDVVQPSYHDTYALTAHGALAGTFTWVGVIGRPQEFTNEWAYTALSRAREHTSIHLISEPAERQRERNEYAPAPPTPGTQQALNQLRRAMKRPETDPLAIEQKHRHQPPAVRLHAAEEPSGIELLRTRQRRTHCRKGLSGHRVDLGPVA
jgi:hypothetical protein